MVSVAVIGAGIVGVATAEWARRSGFSVTLIDRLDVADEGKTSYGNAGILAACAVIPVPNKSLVRNLPFYLFSKESPLFMHGDSISKWRWFFSYLRHGSKKQIERTAENLSFLLHDTVEQHFALAKGTGAEKFLQESDYYYLFKNESDFLNDDFSWGLRKSHGFAGEGLDRTALQKLDSHLGGRYNFAWRMGGHGYVKDPGGYLRTLYNYFLANGGNELRMDVRDIVPLADGRVEVVADTGKYDFDKCVIAGGVHSGVLAKRLGVEAGLVRESGYHIWLREPNFMPSSPYLLSDIKCAMTPMADGLRLAGLAEYGGGNRIDQKAVDYLLKGLSRTYPELTYSRYDVWRGHRPSTVDSLPLVGEHPKYKQVFFACGHQHVGLTGSAKTGRLIAGMLGGEKSNRDMVAFAPERFS